MQKLSLKIFQYLLTLTAIVLAVVSAVACVTYAPATALAEETFSVEGKAAYLADYATGTVLYAKNEHDRLPIASMVKIMTALLTVEAVDAGELSLDEEVFVSENAAGMGGSQVFLDANTRHKAGDLLKSVIVASANDSCVALAERICGSTEGFVKRMNARAAELGMKDTHFANCTGLPAAEGFSSAHDVAVMFGELIRHPVYFDFSKIWLEDYVHPDGRTTSMTNTNKLVRFYNGCDGGKTGFTSEAKFCLAATAQRVGMRVIAVEIGGDSSQGRFNAVSSMFNHAFGNYEVKTLLRAGDPVENYVKVSAGKKKNVELTVNKDVAVFGERGNSSEYELKFELPDKIKAPVAKGDIVGKGYIVRDGEVTGEFEVVAAEDVKRASLLDLIRRIGSRH